jgi:hypothetical protein
MTVLHRGDMRGSTNGFQGGIISIRAAAVHEVFPDFNKNLAKLVSKQRGKLW